MPAEGVILNVSAKFRRKRVTLIFLALRGGNKGHNLRGDVKGHTRQRVGPGPWARGPGLRSAPLGTGCEVTGAGLHVRDGLARGLAAFAGHPLQ